MERGRIDLPDGGEPRRSRWWLWLLGLILLLAFCDDDDDRPRQYCYTFSNGESSERRLCFDEPLPEDQHCYLGADDRVRCFDRPLR